MLGESLVTCIIPYTLVNGVANYVLSKITEKKIITHFNDIKIGKVNVDKTKVNVPEELKKLVSIIEKNVDKENLNNLYNNLESVKIKRNFIMLLMSLKGKYNCKDNTINYSLDGSIEHELMHLASTHCDKNNNICQSGFINYNKNLTFGKALTEGYTDLMTRRLFNKGAQFYNGEVRLVKFIELLFDKKDLEKYYFNNDLVSFINHLSNYISKEEAIKIITTFDFGFDLKKQSNPAYKIIYTGLELKISELAKKYNKKCISKQFELFHLLDESVITNTIQKIKKM